MITQRKLFQQKERCLMRNKKFIIMKILTYLYGLLAFFFYLAYVSHIGAVSADTYFFIYNVCTLLA